MYFSTMDIVMTAIGVLALVGAAIAISAWRHAVRMEREFDKNSSTELPSVV
jgi:hypothetical protein